MLITTLQAKEYLKINATLDDSNFTPFIPDAEEKYLKPVLGDELFAILDTWADEKNPEDDDYEILNALYEKVIPVIARFTLFIAAPQLDVNIGESGFTVLTSNNLVPASAQRVDKSIASMEQLAWNRVEILLKFLEENKDDYPEWVTSDAYTMQLRNLINSAAEFDKYVDIDKSRLTFQKMRHEMDNIERIDVIPVISQEMFDTLMTKIKGDEEVYGELEEMTEQEQKLLTHLRYFVANKAAGKVLKIDTSLVATFHIKEAKALLNLNPDDFPDFRDSGLYDEDDPDIPPFSDYENTEDSSIFVA